MGPQPLAVRLGQIGRGVSSYSHSDLAVIELPEVRLGEGVKLLCGPKPHHAIDPARVIGCTRCTAENNATVLRSRFSRRVSGLENSVALTGGLRPQAATGFAGLGAWMLTVVL